MRKDIHKAIQVVALIMFIGGILGFFVCKYFSYEAGISIFRRDPVAVAMWNFLSIQCIGVAISSVFVLGFSYIVQAACKYLERCEIEEQETEEE